MIPSGFKFRIIFIIPAAHTHMVIEKRIISRGGVLHLLEYEPFSAYDVIGRGASGPAEELLHPVFRLVQQGNIPDMLGQRCDRSAAHIAAGNKEYKGKPTQIPENPHTREYNKLKPGEKKNCIYRQYPFENRLKVLNQRELIRIIAYSALDFLP